MSSQSRNVVPYASTLHKPAHARWQATVLAALFVAAIAFAAFPRALTAGFINLDDDIYVSANGHVQQGLTGPEIGWAWTSNYLGYQIPLTWMSYMVDTDLFGMKPWGYHLTNVILHSANAVLLLLVLQRATGSTWRSVLAAALWAVHPLRVESVAWVTERKDVLAGFFALATLYAYVRYAQSPGRGWFAAVVVGYCLSLLSKPPLAAALPMSVWLLDYWPLGRMAGGPAPAALEGVSPATRAESHRNARKGAARPTTGDPGRRSAWQLAIEKWPLFAVAVVAGIILAVGMRREEQFKGDVYVTWGGRLANAIVAPVRILERFVWFKRLAVIYPLPLGWPAVSVVGAAAFLLVITALVLWQRKRFPWLVVGWFWFAVNMVPSLGIVQGGLKVAMGDRFTYFPAIGLFLMLVWSVPDAWARTVPRRIATATAAAACLIALIVCTWVQLAYWQDSITLFRHVVAVTDNNWMAEHDLAVALSDQSSQRAEALEHFNQSIRLNPNYRLPWENGAILLNRMQRWSDAAEYAARAVSLEPDSLKAHVELESALMKLGRFEEAIPECKEILRLNPKSVDAHMDMAIALFKLGRRDEAIAQMREAVKLDPSDMVAQQNLARAVYLSQHPPAAAPSSGPNGSGQ
jgi:tetratricopeptide (TPR) repeat protein